MAGRGFCAVATHVAGLVFLLTWGAGCQTTQPVSSHRLIEHQALIDFSGLKPSTYVELVKTSIATPEHWQEIHTGSNALYSHEQWRAPSGHTGAGVLYGRLPFPLSPSTVIWFAKHEYAKQGDGGKVLDEWVDPLGRSWFEAENNKYHVRGYVVVHGFSAWVVYFGYRAHYPPDLGEISQAARSAETAVPLLDDPAPPATQPVRAAD